jgi:hypothetical protein
MALSASNAHSLCCRGKAARAGRVGRFFLIIHCALQMPEKQAIGKASSNGYWCCNELSASSMGKGVAAAIEQQHQLCELGNKGGEPMPRKYRKDKRDMQIR